MVHQRVITSEFTPTTPAYYGTDTSSCGLVESGATLLQPGRAPLSMSLQGVVLPVDVAVAPDHRTFHVVSAAVNIDDIESQKLNTFSTSDLTDTHNCQSATDGVSQPAPFVGVALDGNHEAVTQSRDPRVCVLRMVRSWRLTKAAARTPPMTSST